MARILVVDDESLIRVLVADVGESLGHEVLTAASIKEGQDLAQRGVDIVLLDVLLPDGDGLAHVETFSQLPGRPDVIIITGHGNADAAEAALRSGAWEYLVKPLRVRDLSKALTQAVQWRNSRDSQSRSLLRHPDIIGESPALAEALEALREAAASNVNVLITGETGTGKELFASALHANSLRASGPFVTVDCTTLPETLVEAHLFGHARGAFTGADRAPPPTTARCSLTKWANCPSPCRARSCGRWSCAASVPSAKCAKWKAISASSPQPTGISTTWWAWPSTGAISASGYGA